MHAELLPSTGSQRYVIEREIGQGGMGVVYEAHDLERNTRVALKALNHTDALNIYRLKNEFRQLADISHPNLVSLHELCFDGDKWFFTMELVDGQTFDEYVSAQAHTPHPVDRGQLVTIGQRHRLVREASVTLSQRAIGSEFPLPRVTCNVSRLRKTLRQLVEAIAALHHAGKLHRDLKPSNVLVTRDGRVVVLDFGLVSNTTHIDPDAQDAERTIGGCVFGTPAYMSPEQAAGEAVTTASDWYSLGCILYEALTGQLPFDGTVLQILKDKDEFEPIPPAELVRGVPDDLDELCRGLLKRDPEQRPSGSEILRALTGRSNPPPAYAATSSVQPRPNRELFLGRDSHLAALRAAFEQCKEGRAATVFVHGYSGMGKSALVRCFANELIKNEEAVVLRGRCYERESVPYKAFDEVIDALSRYMMRLPTEEVAGLLPRNIHSLARLFPVMRRVKAIAHAHIPLHQTSDQRELRNQAFAALKDLLLRLSDWHPLVVNIDDLQWADMDSARLLTHILGAPDAPPLLFVGVYRREEADTSPFLRHVLGEEAIDRTAASRQELAVDALPAMEAEELTRELLRDYPLANALFTHTIAAESEGVPFFIGELAQHVRTQTHGLPLQLGSVALDNVITARVSSMTADSQRLLEVLSVAARPIEQGVALEAAGLPTGDRAALLALRAARLVRTRGTRQTDYAETYHDRVRETVAAHLGAARVREIHAAIARASETWGVGEPEQLVVHYAGAGQGMRAGETAIHAAHAATEKLAFNRAAELYRRAIELLPDDDANRRRELHRQMGDALANAGRGAQAAQAYLVAAQNAEAADARALQRKAAQQLLRSGRIEEGLRLAERVLADAGIPQPRTPSRAIAAILWNRAAVKVRGLRFARHTEDQIPPSDLERLDTCGAIFREVSATAPLLGAHLQSLFLRLALAAGEPTRVLDGLVWRAILEATRGGPGAARATAATLERAHELATELGTPLARAAVSTAQAASSFYLGRFSDVARPALEAEALYREHQRAGTDWECNYVAGLRYLSLQLTGDLQGLMHEAPQRLRAAKEKADLFSTGMWLLTECTHRLARDDPRAALDILDDQRRGLEGDSFNTLHLSVACRTVDAYLYMGNESAALTSCDAIWPHFTKSVLAKAEFTRIMGFYTRARCLLASASRASGPERKVLLATATVCARDLGRESMRYAHNCKLLVDAGISFLHGDASAAETLYGRAATAFEREGMALYAAAANYRRGHLLASEGGRALVSEAATVMRRQGIQQPARWAQIWAPPGLPD